MTFSRQRGFSLLELLTVVAIIAVLTGMVISLMPDSRRKETEAQILKLQMAVDEYHRSFYVYPRSGGNGYLDDTGVLRWDTSGTTDFYWMLTRKDMVQRDGRYVEQLLVPDANTFTTEAGGDTYFLDGWGHRIAYYSGAELVSDPGAAGTPLCLPNWLRASGKITSGTPSAMAGRYRADEFFFIGSAGADEKFLWDVVQNPTTGDPHDPDQYTYQVLQPSGLWDFDGPDTSLGGGYDDDDMWNYNLSGQY